MDESRAFIEAVTTRDEGTYRGVGPYNMTTADGAFYITSQNGEDARAMASVLNNVIGFRWRSGERQYTMVTGVQLPEVRGTVEFNRGDVVQGAFAKARPRAQQRRRRAWGSCGRDSRDDTTHFLSRRRRTSGRSGLGLVVNDRRFAKICAQPPLAP